jgi:nucleoid-associated protein YgaU
MDKNSVNVQNSRYVSGGETEVNSTRLEWWERIQFEVDPSDMRYTVDIKTEGRLDLIAAAFLGDSHLWWLIAQYNAILDPFSEITIGRVLRIPSKDRAGMLMNGRVGGFKSARTIPLSNITPIV